MYFQHVIDSVFPQLFCEVSLFSSFGDAMLLQLPQSRLISLCTHPACVAEDKLGTVFDNVFKFTQDSGHLSLRRRQTNAFALVCPRLHGRSPALLE